MTTFADELRRIRRSKGLTQGEVARRCAITRAYIVRLEGGTRTTPTRKCVEELAAGLDATPHETNRLLISAGYIPPSIAHLIAAVVYEGGYA